MFHLIQVMQDRKDRMKKHHARAGIAHYFTHLLAHLRLITMHRTFGASGFVFLKRAFINAQHCIVEQLPALGAQALCLPMLTAAIDIDHGPDGAPFSIQAASSHCYRFQEVAKSSLLQFKNNINVSADGDFAQGDSVRNLSSETLHVLNYVL